MSMPVTAATSDHRSAASFDPARAGTLDLPDGRPVIRRGLMLFVVFVLLAAWLAVDASAETVDDLRGDIPTGDEVRAELDQIADDRISALISLTRAETTLTVLLDDRDELDAEQRRLAAEIEAATDNLRRLAVEAFITGGDVGALEYLAAVRGASDFSWRQYLVRSHAGSSQVAVERLRGLRAQADEAVLETIAQAEALRIDIAVLEGELARLEDRQDAANELLPLADAWDRTAVAVAQGSWGIAPADKWAQLRRVTTRPRGVRIINPC